MPADLAIENGQVAVWLNGKKLKGGFALTRIRSGKKPVWLLVKKRDEYANAGHPVADLLAGLPPEARARLRKSPQPEWINPMLATLTIRCPTLVVAGSHDLAVPIHHAKMLHDGISSSRLRIIEGADHALFWTHSDELVRLTEEFHSANCDMLPTARRPNL